MADAEPVMSGAKESVVAAKVLPIAGDATVASTATTATTAATETTGAETGEEDETATVSGVAGEGVAATENKDKQKETAEPEASSSAVAATTDGLVQPAVAAVTRNRGDSLSIGAPDDGTISGAAVDDTVVCNITLLLPTGARHPYRIDEKYLAKRNVDVPGVTESGKKDPFSVSVYKLKELILREWRDEWEGKPASPSSIRLIHFGKLLDDKEQLTTYHFSAEAPNVVHMSVKPAELVDDDETTKNNTNGRVLRSREGGAGCCVIL
ncbi:hypothetical protein CMQ_5785 [Grosmannia clavigera kw1407]|uniref:UBL3-like ubiquitin domain-containing protein n=1 Tax=Grosmannia clavigera (strain kw1407 / UAMH 11150) TaxID=655863 RepID=F0XSP8_GROCL|nr:uncharacterized protein CMQ_5785 [Grosmannia clavigera kw1407]EFW99364.1 hypothetical protein CMQ_5785 [Grosmannia clavigera kw1407]